MKTIKQLRNEIEETANEPTDYPYGEKDILEAQLQTLKDVLKLIDECSKGKGEWYKYYIKIKELKSKIQGK